MARKHYNVTALAFLILHLTLGECTSDLIFQSNGNFTLQPDINGTLEDILWKFEGDKVVECDQSQVIAYGSYKGRTILNLQTGAFTLLKLQTSDSGRYTGELQINGKLHYHQQTVKIYDAVTKPAVTCQINSSTVTLRCAGDQSPLTEYSWVGPGIQNKPGSELQLNNEDIKSSDAVYTCVVKNPVSNRSEDFDAKTCLPAPGGSSAVITVLIIALILITIVLGLAFMYYKKYCKKKTKEEDVETLHHGNVGRQEKEFQKTLKGFSSENTDEHKNESECLITPTGKVKRIVKDYEERGKGKTCLSKPSDERSALIEKQKNTGGSVGISQEETNAGLGEERRETKDESSSTSDAVPFSQHRPPSAPLPKTDKHGVTDENRDGEKEGEEGSMPDQNQHPQDSLKSLSDAEEDKKRLSSVHSETSDVSDQSQQSTNTNLADSKTDKENECTSPLNPTPLDHDTQKDSARFQDQEVEGGNTKTKPSAPLPKTDEAEITDENRDGKLEGEEGSMPDQNQHPQDGLKSLSDAEEDKKSDSTFHSGTSDVSDQSQQTTNTNLADSKTDKENESTSPLNPTPSDHDTQKDSARFQDQEVEGGNTKTKPSAPLPKTDEAEITDENRDGKREGEEGSMPDQNQHPQDGLKSLSGTEVNKKRRSSVHSETSDVSDQSQQTTNTNLADSKTDKENESTSPLNPTPLDHDTQKDSARFQDQEVEGGNTKTKPSAPLPKTGEAEITDENRDGKMEGEEGSMPDQNQHPQGGLKSLSDAEEDKKSDFTFHSGTSDVSDQSQQSTNTNLADSKTDKENESTSPLSPTPSDHDTQKDSARFQDQEVEGGNTKTKPSAPLPKTGEAEITDENRDGKMEGEEGSMPDQNQHPQDGLKSLSDAEEDKKSDSTFHSGTSDVSDQCQQTTNTNLADSKTDKENESTSPLNPTPLDHDTQKDSARFQDQEVEGGNTKTKPSAPLPKTDEAEITDENRDGKLEGEEGSMPDQNQHPQDGLKSLSDAEEDKKSDSTFHSGTSDVSDQSQQTNNTNLADSKTDKENESTSPLNPTPLDHDTQKDSARFQDQEVEGGNTKTKPSAPLPKTDEAEITDENRDGKLEGEEGSMPDQNQHPQDGLKSLSDAEEDKKSDSTFHSGTSDVSDQSQQTTNTNLADSKTDKENESTSPLNPTPLDHDTQKDSARFQDQEVEGGNTKTKPSAPLPKTDEAEITDENRDGKREGEEGSMPDQNQHPQDGLKSLSGTEVNKKRRSSVHSETSDVSDQSQQTTNTNLADSKTDKENESTSPLNPTPLDHDTQKDSARFQDQEVEGGNTKTKPSAPLPKTGEAEITDENTDGKQEKYLMPDPTQDTPDAFWDIGR